MEFKESWAISKWCPGYLLAEALWLFEGIMIVLGMMIIVISVLWRWLLGLTARIWFISGSWLYNKCKWPGAISGRPEPHGSLDTLGPSECQTMLNWWNWWNIEVQNYPATIVAHGNERVKALWLAERIMIVLEHDDCLGDADCFVEIVFWGQ